MAEILLFHHALGLTPGVEAFADELRAGGHVVHVPDLYEGATFTTVDEGVAQARKIGFETLVERGVREADSLPAELVYGGFSLGVVPAQKLTQTRAGAKGALYLHSAIRTSEFDRPWPDGVPAQVHTMQDDEWGDADIAREFAAEVPTAELFLYPGDRHLFTDNSLADYDEDAAALVKQRALDLLSRV